jgi:hypothetical protein
MKLQIAHFLNSAAARDIMRQLLKAAFTIFLNAAFVGETTRHAFNHFKCPVKFHTALGSSISSWLSDFPVNCTVLVKQIILR